MASFVPRIVFPTLDSLPRSYFLGHHKAGLDKMKSMLSSVDLLLECRDYRVPMVSRNPLFEDCLAGRQRLVIFTKQDLGSQSLETDRRREEILRRWHFPTSILFSNFRDSHSVRKILDFARKHTASTDRLTGSRMMIVGMPNVGKSSLLNALRRSGVNKGKVAHTGAQPGITRRIGTSVKIFSGKDESEGIYLWDTPGVFIPYVPNAESMLKLALCGCVKDTIISPIVVADYLLYQLNMKNPAIYRDYSKPSNDINQLLDAVAHKTGRLQKGGNPDAEAAALWFIQRWRNGNLGKMVLDQVSEQNFEIEQPGMETVERSLSSARKAARDAQRQRPKK